MKAIRPSFIVLSVCGLLTAAGYALALRPQLAKLRALHREEVALRLQVASGADFQRDLQAARAQVNEVHEAVAAVRNRFVTAATRELFLTELLRCGEESGVRIHEVRPLAVVAGPLLDLLPIELSAEGSYRELFALLTALQALNRPCQVEQLAVSNPSVRGSSRILIRLHLCLLKEGLPV